MSKEHQKEEQWGETDRKPAARLYFEISTSFHMHDLNLYAKWNKSHKQKKKYIYVCIHISGRPPDLEHILQGFFYKAKQNYKVGVFSEVTKL